MEKHARCAEHRNDPVCASSGREDRGYSGQKVRLDKHLDLFFTTLGGILFACRRRGSLWGSRAQSLVVCSLRGLLCIALVIRMVRCTVGRVGCVAVSRWCCGDSGLVVWSTPVFWLLSVATVARSRRGRHGGRDWKRRTTFNAWRARRKFVRLIPHSASYSVRGIFFSDICRMMDCQVCLESNPAQNSW